MARQKKDGQGINCYLERSVYNMLEEHCQRTGQSKTVAIERAIAMYVTAEKEKERLAEEAAGKTV